MKTSTDGLLRLEKREGVKTKAYKDVKGIWTIGEGHTGPEVHEGLVWTIQQIQDALAKDVGIEEDCINKYVKVPLTQYQFDALVSFVFNVGVNAFIKSTMLKKLNLKDYAGAANEFDRWNIPAEIIGRRATEKAQFKGL